MTGKKRKILVFWGILEVLLANLAAIVLGYQFWLPEQFYVNRGELLRLDGIGSVLTFAGEESEDSTEPVSGTVRLFGVLPVKSVDVQFVERREVIVSGVPFGIKLYADGVIVVSMTDVDTAQGMQNPARKAGLKTGDIILAINGEQLESNGEAAEIFEQSNGEELLLTVRRGEKEWETVLVPEFSVSAQAYKAGVWIRDSTAGMGMMTCIDPESGECVGLGHGISDTDTGVLIPVAGGEICQARLVGVVKGKRGTPGQLTGCFEPGELGGTVQKNSETGMYGVLDAIPQTGIRCVTAQKQEAKTGRAEILTTVQTGEPRFYEVKIEKISYNGTQNFVIHVTDPILLDITGGIVQGMSGSPIIQEGKLIGAVTHVLVNDPTRGYGIFIENMLDAAE